MEQVARNPFTSRAGFNWNGANAPRTDRHVDTDASESERTYAMFTHLTSVLALLAGLPVVAALIMWAIKRKESPFLDDHGREAVHFQLSLFIYGLLLVPLAFLTFGVGVVLGLPILALGIVGTVLAAQAAHRGEYYRYPMTMRFF